MYMHMHMCMHMTAFRGHAWDPMRAFLLGRKNFSAVTSAPSARTHTHSYITRTHAHTPRSAGTLQRGRGLAGVGVEVGQAPSVLKLPCNTVCTVSTGLGVSSGLRDSLEYRLRRWKTWKRPHTSPSRSSAAGACSRHSVARGMPRWQKT